MRGLVSRFAILHLNGEVVVFDYLRQIFGPLVAAIGTLVLAGGGISAIAYGLFRFFGERWLNAKFEERLAAYKHAQQKELEHLRLEIN
jgi:hypothetical protein